jgi:hypothetical protein
VCDFDVFLRDCISSDSTFLTSTWKMSAGEMNEMGEVRIADSSMDKEHATASVELASEPYDKDMVVLSRLGKKQVLKVSISTLLEQGFVVKSSSSETSDSSPCQGLDAQYYPPGVRSYCKDSIYPAPLPVLKSLPELS